MSLAAVFMVGGLFVGIVAAVLVSKSKSESPIVPIIYIAGLLLVGVGVSMSTTCN